MWRQSANHSHSLRWEYKTAPWEFQTKLLHYFFLSNNKSNLHFTSLTVRGLRASQTSKGLFRMVASAAVDCHKNLWRAKATTSFKFAIHSAFHSPQSKWCLSESSNVQNLNPSSDSKFQVAAAFTIMKIISWSRHTVTFRQITLCVQRARSILLTVHLSTDVRINVRWCLNGKLRITENSHNNSISPWDSPWSKAPGVCLRFSSLYSRSTSCKPYSQSHIARTVHLIFDVHKRYVEFSIMTSSIQSIAFAIVQRFT